MAYNSSDWYQVNMAQMANERAIAKGNIQAAGIRANADILSNLIGTLGNTVGQGLQTILNYKLQKPRMDAETKLLTMQASRAEREERISLEEDVSNQMILPTLLRLNNGFGSADRAIQIKTAAELDNFFTEFATKPDAPLRISKSTLDTMIALQNQAANTLITDIDDPTMTYSAREMAAAIRNVNHPLHEVAMRQVTDGSSAEGQKMIAPFIAQGVNADGSDRLTRGQTRLAALGAALTDPSLLKTEDEYAANMDHPIWTTIKKMVGDIGSVAFAPMTSIALMNQLGRAFKDADASTILRYVEENKKLATKHAQTLDPSAGNQLARNVIKINAFTTKYNLPVVTEEDFYPTQFQSRRGISAFDVKRSLDQIRNDMGGSSAIASPATITPEAARAELERRRAAGGK